LTSTPSIEARFERANGVERPRDESIPSASGNRGREGPMPA
jgi:hypothetical protein